MALRFCLSCVKRKEEEVIQLDYRHCSLDDVPNHVFNYERTLEVLHLDSNNIRDLPRPLFHCHGLRYLGLADNEISVLPPAIASLSQLVSLDVSRNILTDVPETIKQCKLLSVLEASVNPLQRIPEGCTQLVSLSELYLNDVFLEYLPANFGRLAKLRILELRENSLNSLPKSMARLTNLTRIDLGQNQFTEIPEVVEHMTLLEELWMDGNRLKSLPSIVGNLINLKHLDLSFNQLAELDGELGKCTKLEDLTLSTNDLKRLPDSISNLESLITLKVDDNQLEALPDGLGKMAALEEIFCGDNFLTVLPPSIGWLRRLNTLNLDENDLEELPPEIGSCRHLRILSLHGNKLTGIPSEVGHLNQLAVLNLAGNAVAHLPISFVKLKQITAIWLSDNQTKPLVQLNQDTDHYTGQKVLTNFLLPQMVIHEGEAEDLSENGSFQQAAWDEERGKRSLVKWAGEQQDLDKTGQLRRAPTPFPKEMRAMAKKVQDMREKKKTPESGTTKRKARDQRSKGGRSTDGNQSAERNQTRAARAAGKPQPQPQDRDLHGLHLQQRLDVDPRMEARRPSPDKISRDSGVTSPSEGDSITAESLGGGGGEHSVLANGDPGGGSAINDTGAPTTTTTPALAGSPHPTPLSAPHQQTQSPRLAREKTPVASAQKMMPKGRFYPDVPAKMGKTHPGLNVTGSPMPVKAEIITNELKNLNLGGGKEPPPYHIAAAGSTKAGQFSKTPILKRLEEEHQYENQESIAVRRSGPHYVPGLERKSSFLSDGTFESISESETSTAPSSLQTIIRAPNAATAAAYAGFSNPSLSSSSDSPSPTPSQVRLSEYNGKNLAVPDSVKASSAAAVQPTANSLSEQDAEFFSASNLRKVSEKLLANERNRSNMSGYSVSNQKASPFLTNGKPTMGASQNGTPIGIGSSSSSSDSRPESRMSQAFHPSSVASGTSRPNSSNSSYHLPASALISQLAGAKNSRPERRPSLFAGPPNTVGLPPVHSASNSPLPFHGSTTASPMIAAHHMLSPKPELDSSPMLAAETRPASHAAVVGRVTSPLSHSNSLQRGSSVGSGFQELGLLSTISQAALSDDESPPVTHVPNPPKFNTASLSRPHNGAGAHAHGIQPNYENVDANNKPAEIIGSNNGTPLTGNPAKRLNGTKLNMGHHHHHQAAEPLPRAVPGQQLPVGKQYAGRDPGMNRLAAGGMVANHAMLAKIPNDDDQSSAYLPMQRGDSGQIVPVPPTSSALAPLATSSPSTFPQPGPSLLPGKT